MRRSLLCLTVAVSLLAGCVADTPAPSPLADATDVTPPGAGTAPIFDAAACHGHNVLHFSETSPLRPHVPANWTFTAPQRTQDLGILRVLLVGCDSARFAIVSTPMHPDEASAHHHDNPDVVLAIYSDDVDAVTAWRAAGQPAEDATIEWSEGPTGDTVHVATANGTAIHFISVDARHPAHRAYVWPATYAAGTETIRWMWGHENATARAASTQELTLGPASPVPGLVTAPWNTAAWLDFDLTYQTGTPSD